MTLRPQEEEKSTARAWRQNGRNGRKEVSHKRKNITGDKQEGNLREVATEEC